MTRLILLLSLFAALVRPVATFSVKCAPATLQCSVDASRSTGATSYEWSWGDGRKEAHTFAKAANTWPAGSYCVKLIVRGAAGDSSYATKMITVPTTSASSFRACPRATSAPVPPTQPPIPPAVPPIVPPAQPPTPPSRGEAWATLPAVYLDTKAPAAPGVRGQCDQRPCRR
jgi:PKD repeat protein